MADDLREKFIRLETDQHHMAKTLDRLTDISEQMNRTLNQLTSHQAETRRLGSQMKAAEKRLAEHEAKMAIMAEAMLPLEDLTRRISECATVTTVTKWIAGVILTGGITLAYTFIGKGLGA